MPYQEHLKELQTAVAGGDIKAAADLLAALPDDELKLVAGTNLLINDLPLLHHFVLNFNTAGVNALLAAGADPDITDEADGAAMTALQRLLFWKAGDAAVPAMAKVLLQQKADPDAVPGAPSPLESAVRWGSAALVELLLLHGAEPDPPPSSDCDHGTLTELADALQHDEWKYSAGNRAVDKKELVRQDGAIGEMLRRARRERPYLTGEQRAAIVAAAAECVDEAVVCYDYENSDFEVKSADAAERIADCVDSVLRRTMPRAK